MVSNFKRLVFNTFKVNRLPILTYHRVVEEPDTLYPDNIDKVRFERQMSTLAMFFNVLPLRDAIVQLKEGCLPKRTICITFDDGYADNADIALPILKRYEISATVFVATGYINGGIMWNDIILESIRQTKAAKIDLKVYGLDSYELSCVDEKRCAAKEILRKIKYLQPKKRNEFVCVVQRALDIEMPKNLMLSDEQIVKLDSNDIEIGGHTVTHPILKLLDDQEIEWELRESKRYLEALTNKSVVSFAYPNGRPGVDFDGRISKFVARAGYQCSVSTRVGVASQEDDLFQLPRIGSWDNQRWKFAARLLMS